jgi:hypothetical protein
MASRIRLFNRTGTLIYEVSAPAFREFVLNDIGSANFTIKALNMEQYIEFGNYVLIEHSKLNSWVGVIVTPRPWTPKVITVNCKSAMWLFGQRVGSYTQPVSGSWGDVLTQVLGVVNAAESTLLQIGVFNSGNSYSSTVDMSNPYTYLQRAIAQAGTRLDFRPLVTNGKLKIFIDIQPTLYTPSSLRLEEGLNIKNSTSVLLQQGEIYNDITVLGVSLDQNKFTGHAEDAASIAKYGRRQKLFSEGQSQADVDRLAVMRLAQYNYPRVTLGLVTMDKGNTFLDTKIGNSGSVDLKSLGYRNGALGFRGTAYIRTLQYDDKVKEAVLVCEEVR